MKISAKFEAMPSGVGQSDSTICFNVHLLTDILFELEDMNKVKLRLQTITLDFKAISLRFQSIKIGTFLPSLLQKMPENFNKSYIYIFFGFVHS